jgi:hypothetical protein
MWRMRQQWMQQTCCSAFKMAVPRLATVENYPMRPSIHASSGRDFFGAFSSTVRNDGITPHKLNCLLNELRLLSDESLDLRVNSLINSWRPEYRSPPRTVNCPPNCCQGNICLVTFYLATTHSLLFVAEGTWLPSRCSAMDVHSGCTIPAFRLWLPSRCLAWIIQSH